MPAPDPATRRIEVLLDWRERAAADGHAVPSEQDMKRIGATGDLRPDGVLPDGVEPWAETIRFLLTQLKFGLHDPISYLPYDLTRPAPPLGARAPEPDTVLAALVDWWRVLRISNPELNGLKEHHLRNVATTGSTTAAEIRRHLPVSLAAFAQPIAEVIERARPAPPESRTVAGAPGDDQPNSGMVDADVAEALDRLEATPEPVRELAELASLAVVVSPALLRAVRLRAAPHLDAGHEADLWWSPLVASRGAAGLVFAAEVTRVLRGRLRTRPAAGDFAVAGARAAVAALPPADPAMRLEQELAWLGVAGGASATEEIDTALAAVLHSLLVEGRAGLADWWRAAWARLPDETRAMPTAMQLSHATAPLLGPDAVDVARVEAGAVDTHAVAALRAPGDVPLGVRRQGSDLVLGDVDGDGAVSIMVPDADPVYLEVRREGGDPVVHHLFRHAVTHVDVGPLAVELRTARGAVYEIPADLAAAAGDLTRPAGVPPLGATVDAGGTTFAVYSGTAQRVELCLFTGNTESRTEMHRMTGNVWAARVAGAGPGLPYGFRVHGPWDPGRGHWHNPTKLLLDPWARAVDGPVTWTAALHGFRADDPDQPDVADSAPFVPRAVVIDPAFDWGDDAPPNTPLDRTVLYEAHVKGMTALHPDVPEPWRGTFAGVAHPAVVGHLTELGVTALALMPVQESLTPRRLVDRGLTDYWGYDTLAPFAAHHGYATAAGGPGAAVHEFRGMVQSLHRAGIEVILDIVVDHTAEGDASGPMLSLRGIDNHAYYRLGRDPRRYLGHAGNANSLNLRHPRALQLVLDVLRYWVTEMHVDGFRFDMGFTLPGSDGDTDRVETALTAIAQDPVLGRVKLISRPPNRPVERAGPLSAEWNVLFRDTVRGFWRGEPGQLGSLASGISGSADLFQGFTERPTASINFITSHDGFTLRDLVSYDQSDNTANGAGNRGGAANNRSWNCGFEGPTDDPAVLALRARQQRNLLATLLLSQGVPMLAHGDELGRTQGGNNNAWCQDNAISWVDWDNADRELLAFTAGLLAIRAAHPVLRRRRFLTGRRAGGSEWPDVTWYQPDGVVMGADDWSDAVRACLVAHLDGGAVTELDPRGERISDASFLLCINADPDDVEIVLPPTGRSWQVLVDTALGTASPEGRQFVPADSMLLRPGRSLQLLRQVG